MEGIDERKAPKPWRLPATSMAWRLFLSAWIIFSLHFATDIVREHYPAIALGDHFTFRLDEYSGLHPDLFEKPGYGWHIGNNPGVSMLAAIPYALARPLIDRINDRVVAGRMARGEAEPPAFDSPRTRSANFFAETYRRGIDVKLGLAAFVTHAFLMAPSSAVGVVLIFLGLRWATRSDRLALLLALLYGFGTPVFFRTGFLNHNLMLGHIAFAGFLALWNPGGRDRPSIGWRHFLAGLAGGTAILFDYSGVVFLLGLFGYALGKRFAEASARDALRHGALYVLGTLGPVFLLWFYQWRSFGNPFLPGQNWMPPVEYIDRGYQGYSAPQLDLLLSLGFDQRFGLFTMAPALVFGFFAPLVARKADSGLPRLEMWVCLLLFTALWVFFAGNNYSNLQWNTGVRYMAAGIPFLFVPAAIVLLRMPRPLFAAVALVSVVINWSAAMHREVWHPTGVFGPVISVLTGGFELPALTTLSRMQMFGSIVEHGVSPLPLMVLAAVIIAIIWQPADGRV